MREKLKGMRSNSSIAIGGRTQRLELVVYVELRAVVNLWIAAVVDRH